MFMILYSIVTRGVWALHGFMELMGKTKDFGGKQRLC